MKLKFKVALLTEKLHSFIKGGPFQMRLVETGPWISNPKLLV